MWCEEWNKLLNHNHITAQLIRAMVTFLFDLKILLLCKYIVIYCNDCFAIARQFFYDAIPMVATEASMALTKKLISDKIVQGTEAEMWLTQLAFIPKPTIAMLSAVKVCRACSYMYSIMNVHLMIRPQKNCPCVH